MQVVTETLQLYRDRLLQSELISVDSAIRHGFTGRIPGLEPAEGNIGFSAPRDRVAAAVERERWARASGIDPDAIYTVHQIHGNQVAAIDQPRSATSEIGPSLGQADAIMTATPGVAVMTLHADCLAIILVDPSKPAVCAIHAGWRGTVVDVVGAAVSAMQSTYGSDPGSLIAVFGPGMKSCCYEVGDEVVEAWRAVAGDDADIALKPGPRRWHFDLGLANRWLLERAGVRSAQIDDPGLCTMCNGDRWFSHRQQGPDTGRFGAIVGIAPQDHSGDVSSWS
ncbi:peptidoglycan editing factor PgeF [soil metagenome]